MKKLLMKTVLGALLRYTGAQLLIAYYSRKPAPLSTRDQFLRIMGKRRPWFKKKNRVYYALTGPIKEMHESPGQLRIIFR